MSAYVAEVDRIAESEWSSLLERFDDANVYQAWAYGRVRWGDAHLSHVLLRRDGEAAAMAQIRVVQMPVLGGGFAYLRWGPLWKLRGGAAEPEVIARMMGALRDEFVARRRLVLRMVPRSFANEPGAADLKAQLETAGLRVRPSASPYRTFLVDLRPSLDELRARLEKKWRKRLRQAEDHGLEIVESSSDESFAVLMDLYAEMLGRKNFAAFVDPSEFREMQRQLPDAQKLTLLVCRSGGTPVSAAVFSGMGATGLCLLAATNLQGRELQASYLVKWKTIEWMKQRGFQQLDLGGRDPQRTPEVDHFKAGLGGADAFHVGEFQALRHHPGNLVALIADGLRENVRRLRVLAE